MVEHLRQETRSVRTAGEAEEEYIVSRRVVSH